MICVWGVLWFTFGEDFFGRVFGGGGCFFEEEALEGREIFVAGNSGWKVSFFSCAGEYVAFGWNQLFCSFSARTATSARDVGKERDFIIVMLEEV